ncbi:uncharacterized protein K02A2.6-like [Acyrthosiphon pisum]|uniref:RNA-directed DNA polymerase n=1 Tax=Acyrthosiphon pisum TaxID=7029 RepID=A0A8R2B4U9_ACYPI|nr:uncharacterized protein K02A2.6-like [Acyrthosiphon pisum]|eukprot:XP_008181766.1 PREDICTED: uncharacterized protein K02A2.6-like [Acyrthosiphon pisum]
MLKIVHEGHMGIERCKNSIKDLIFWPNINSDIKNIVENCEVCMKYRNNNSKEPLIPHDIPQIPWFKLGTDIFHFDNKIYLLVVDYYSKFVEIAHLTSGFTSISVIQHLKSIFARFGIPSVIVSDNGPPFNSLEFKQFMHEWDIEHVTSSPNYAQSNGLAERSIQSIKKLLKKFQGEKGGNYRRNRKHLIASSLTTSKTINYELDTQPNLNLNLDKKCTRSGRMIVKPKRLDL